VNIQQILALLGNRGMGAPGGEPMEQGLGGMTSISPGMAGSAMPQPAAQPPQQQPGFMGRVGGAIRSGLGRLGETIAPVDASTAANIDPEHLKQLRRQALMQSGLGMLAASGNNGFGPSVAAGLGQGIGGFNKGVGTAYERAIQAQETKRQQDRQGVLDTRYNEEQLYRRERDSESDRDDERNFQASQQYRKDSLASLDRRSANKAAGVTLSDNAIDFAAKRLLNGEPAAKVLANFGRGAQGAQNITAVQNRLAELASEGGVSPQLMAVLSQELAADSRTRLELGAREGKVAARVEEAKQFAKIAGEASTLVPRGSFVPVTKLMQMTDTQLSDPKLAAFKAANVSLINAYAAAVGAGVPTVHDKEAAEKMLSTAQSPEAYQAVVNQLIVEMDAALAAPRNVMEQMRSHDLSQPGPWSGGLGTPHAAPATQASPSSSTGGWSIRPVP
jgi:hypothetical protein